MSKPFIVLMNHGKFGNELIKSAEMIVGSIKEIIDIPLEKGISLEEYIVKATNVFDSVKDREIIVLTDLFGGTPSNVSIMLSRKYQISIICGMNLPVLICTVLKRDNSEDNANIIVKKVLEETNNSISNPLLKINDYSNISEPNQERRKPLNGH